MIKKLHFTKSGEKKTAKILTTVGSHEEIVHFRTIEIRNSNPSDLVIVIEKAKALRGTQDIRILLVDFRTSFHKEEDLYILDVRNLSRFIDTENYFEVNVYFKSIHQEEPIDICVYYALEDEAEYSWHSNILLQEIQ